MKNRICARSALSAIAVFFVAVGLPTGCGRSTDGEPYYNLTVQNLSGNSIFTVTLSFSDYEWDVGDLGLGITKTQVGCMEPPPSTLTLSWAVSGGEPQQRKIILTEFLPADFEGEITVQMNPEGNVILNVEHKER